MINHMMNELDNKIHTLCASEYRTVQNFDGEKF